jgi:predicted Zn-dependent peptidase
VAKNIEALGGKLVKDAAYEFAYFDVVLPSRSLSQGIDLLSEALAHAKVDAVSLAAAKSRETKVSKGLLGSAERAAVSELLPELHPGNPLGAPLGFPEHEFNMLTIPLVERFYKERYVAENLTIVVTGDVDAQEVAGKVEAAFKDMPRGRAGSRSKPSERALAGPRAILRTNPETTTGAAVAIGFRGPVWGTSDALALDVLMALLVDGTASRTQQRLNSGDASFSTPAAIRQFETDGGSVTFSLLCDPDSLDAAEGELLRLVEQARSTQVSADEFRDGRARSSNATFSPVSIRAPGRATAIAALHGQPGSDEAWSAGLKAIRPEDLIAVGASTSTSSGRCCRDGPRQSRGDEEEFRSRPAFRRSRRY